MDAVKYPFLQLITFLHVVVSVELLSALLLFLLPKVLIKGLQIVDFQRLNFSLELPTIVNAISLPQLLIIKNLCYYRLPYHQ